MKTTKFAVVALAASALVLSASPASADSQGGAPSSKPISNQQGQPFNLAIRANRLLVADGDTSLVSRVRADGSLRTIASGPQPGEVAGVAISRTGRYTAYTSTEHPDPTNPLVNANGTLHILDRYGPDRDVDLAKYEDQVNPDGAVSYGAVNPTDTCREAIESVPDAGPATYTGIKDSHPYSVTGYGKRSWIVADAAGNDLLKVNRRGRISTVAVLPVQPVVITAPISDSLGLKGACVGVTVNFEPVPTDVEVGRDGWLYVTTLAGGPESEALGARSSVYRVNPRNGRIKLVATGLSGATNLALHNGKIYVAEFFAGQISVIKNGRPKPYLALPGVVSVESSRLRHGSLYAGTFGSGSVPGAIVKIVTSKLRS